ncbi:hypothetical protein [Paucilactobacillus sp. N302-9]
MKKINSTNEEPKKYKVIIVQNAHQIVVGEYKKKDTALKHAAEAERQYFRN